MAQDVHDNKTFYQRLGKSVNKESSAFGTPIAMRQLS